MFECADEYIFATAEESPATLTKFVQLDLQGMLSENLMLGPKKDVFDLSLIWANLFWPQYRTFIFTLALKSIS